MADVGRVIAVHPSARPHRTRRGVPAFTLVEILIVVVILGILAAVVIPQFNSAVQDARAATAAAQSRELRAVLTRYAVDHDGQYPGVYMINNQLTQWTDRLGNVAGNRTATCTIVPYLTSIPAAGTGPGASLNTISPAASPYKSGWVYDETTGSISVNIMP